MDHAPQPAPESPPASPPAPETTLVDTSRVWCDGAGDIRSGANYRPAALGHPRVYMEIGEEGFVDCGYCDRRFILAGGPADGAAVPDVAA